MRARAHTHTHTHIHSRTYTHSLTHVHTFSRALSRINVRSAPLTGLLSILRGPEVVAWSKGYDDAVAAEFFQQRESYLEEVLLNYAARPPNEQDKLRTALAREHAKNLRVMQDYVERTGIPGAGGQSNASSSSSSSMVAPGGATATPASTPTAGAGGGHAAAAAARGFTGGGRDLEPLFGVGDLVPGPGVLTDSDYPNVLDFVTTSDVSFSGLVGPGPGGVSRTSTALSFTSRGFEPGAVAVAGGGANVGGNGGTGGNGDLAGAVARSYADSASSSNRRFASPGNSESAVTVGFDPSEASFRGGGFPTRDRTTTGMGAGGGGADRVPTDRSKTNDGGALERCVSEPRLAHRRGRGRAVDGLHRVRLRLDPSLVVFRWDQLVPDGTVGCGGFNAVLKATYGSSTVAVKLFENIHNVSQAQAFVREASVLASLAHENGQPALQWR